MGEVAYVSTPMQLGRARLLHAVTLPGVVACSRSRFHDFIKRREDGAVRRRCALSNPTLATSTKSRSRRRRQRHESMVYVLTDYAD